MSANPPVSPPKKPKREAYVWCRQFSRDRLEELAGIRRARAWWLDGETARRAAFSRVQIGNTDRWYNVHRCIDGEWEGREAHFDVTIRPLFIRYAADVFRRALLDTLLRYPDFTRVEFEDGPLAGERRVVFPDRLDEAATTWLFSRFWHIAEEGDVRAREGFSAKCDDGGGIIGGRVTVKFEIDLDRPETNEATWRELRDLLCAGKLPEIDPSPRRCDTRLSYSMLKHLSVPELFALNWAECLPALGGADRALLEAAGKLDTGGLRAALASGADPNAIDGPKAQTALGLAVEQTGRFEGDEGYSESAADERDQLALRAIDLLADAGAAVDLAPFNESTPLAAACLSSGPRIVTRLLEHGADPSILCYDDDYKGDWGGAWEYANYRCDPVIDMHDSSAWDALTKFYPPPYEGVGIEPEPNTP